MASSSASADERALAWPEAKFPAMFGNTECDRIETEVLTKDILDAAVVEIQEPPAALAEISDFTDVLGRIVCKNKSGKQTSVRNVRCGNFASAVVSALQVQEEGGAPGFGDDPSAFLRELVRESCKHANNERSEYFILEPGDDRNDAAALRHIASLVEQQMFCPALADHTCMRPVQASDLQWYSDDEESTESDAADADEEPAPASASASGSDEQTSETSRPVQVRLSRGGRSGKDHGRLSGLLSARALMHDFEKLSHDPLRVASWGRTAEMASVDETAHLRASLAFSSDAVREQHETGMRMALRGLELMMLATLRD